MRAENSRKDDRTRACPAPCGGAAAPYSDNSRSFSRAVGPKPRDW
jgi:hypothetical protein